MSSSNGSAQRMLAAPATPKTATQPPLLRIDKKTKPLHETAKSA